MMKPSVVLDQVADLAFLEIEDCVVEGRILLLGFGGLGDDEVHHGLIARALGIDGAPDEVLVEARWGSPSVCWRWPASRRRPFSFRRRSCLALDAVIIVKR